MLAVEVRIFNEEALVAAMTGMREWLDHRHFEPTTFRYTFNSPGIVCRVEFADESEAAAFAEAFGGRVVALQDPSPATSRRDADAPRISGINARDATRRDRQNHQRATALGANPQPPR
jgi:hypothetical protein